MMRYKQVLIGVLFFLCASVTHAFAQSSFTSSGGIVNGESGAATYSVGEVAYTVASGSGNDAIAGVQQPYEISEVITSPVPPYLTFHFTVYPIPAKEYINLSIKNYKGTFLTCQLMDMDGKQLKNQTLTSDKTLIPLSGLAPATYLLNIIQNKIIIKTFKILKR